MTALIYKLTALSTRVALRANHKRLNS